MITALALADFRDRVRRPAYAVTLIAAVGLGFVAVPDADARWVVLYVGNYRGLYNSAYVGTLVALASVVWLMLGGFYVVRNAVGRDERRGVGQLLAATPMRTVSYLAGKLLSNVLVLASMVGVLAGTALVMQLARGESRQVDPLALLAPFVLLALPVVTMTAAAALLMETIRPLRAGFGNILWFFIWMVGATAGQSADAPLGGLGVHEVARSMRDDMIANGISTEGLDFSLGLMYVDNPLRTFVWSGFDVTGGFVANRLLLVALAVGVALLPALWFGRFDPARSRYAPAAAPPGYPQPVPAGRPQAAPAGYPQAVPVGYPGPAGYLPAPPAGYPPSTAGYPSTVAVRPDVHIGRPRTTIRSGSTFGRLLVGEFRILIQGVSWWWWLGAGLLTLVALVVPTRLLAAPLLPVIWIWPVLIWSRLGTQRHEYGVDALLGAYPAARRRLLAEWMAGILLTGLVGAVPVVRMAIAGDGPGVAAWVAGAVFIPSFALLLGVLSRTHRLFQALYLCLWYTLVNGFAVVDYMGAIRDGGKLAGPHPAVVIGLSLAMLAIVFAAGTVRRHART